MQKYILESYINIEVVNYSADTNLLSKILYEQDNNRMINRMIIKNTGANWTKYIKNKNEITCC